MFPTDQAILTCNFRYNIKKRGKGCIGFSYAPGILEEQWPFLLVLVAALTSKTDNLVFLAFYDLPFPLVASAVFLVHRPDQFCVVDRDYLVAFCQRSNTASCTDDEAGSNGHKDRVQYDIHHETLLF